MAPPTLARRQEVRRLAWWKTMERRLSYLAGSGRRWASLLLFTFPHFLSYKLLWGRCASPLFLLFILFPPPAWSISRSLPPPPVRRRGLCHMHGSTICTKSTTMPTYTMPYADHRRGRPEILQRIAIAIASFSEIICTIIFITVPDRWWWCVVLGELLQYLPGYRSIS